MNSANEVQESIKIALDAADAATDITSEYNKIKSENKSRNFGEIKVKSFNNLLIDFARSNSVTMIIRGLRAVSDFDYEFQMAGMNARLASDIETVFLTASERHQFVASRFVKEIALLDGDISSFVPENVAKAIEGKKKLKK